MKTLEDVQADYPNMHVSTMDDFCKMCCDGLVSSQDDPGYLHDGTNKTAIPIWDEDIALIDLTKFPYVVWKHEGIYD